jgi:glycosyltransferase involved in cell wall biosynthesis
LGNRPLRVALVDPSGYSRPYDHELARALARRGHEVTLWTARFVHGRAPQPDGYEVREHFYRRTNSLQVGSRLRPAAKAGEHLLDLRRMGAQLGREPPDVVHVQWCVLRPVERRYYRRLSARGRAVVFTAHDPVPNIGGAARRRSAAATARAFPRVICHSEWGRAALVERCGVDPARVRVIPHGAFGYLRELAQAPAPCEGDGPLAVAPGLIRPYKGVDVLLEAWPAVRERVPGACLLVAGRPMMDTSPLPLDQPGVTFLPRFLSDEELAALLRRADVVALPYRRIDNSGVLAAALAFGAPLVLSDVGGFGELHRAEGVGELVPPGDAGALAAALARVLSDPEVRARLAAASERAAAGPLGWDSVAEQTERVYLELTQNHAGPSGV